MLIYGNCFRYHNCQPRNSGKMERKFIHSIFNFSFRVLTYFCQKSRQCVYKLNSRYFENKSYFLRKISFGIKFKFQKRKDKTRKLFSKHGQFTVKLLTLKYYSFFKGEKKTSADNISSAFFCKNITLRFPPWNQR